MFNFNRNKVTQKDSEIIRKQSNETLCNWHSAINSFGNVSELNYCAEKGKWNPNNKGSQLMEFIKQAIGHKIILQQHNKNRMTEEEFEDFWQNSATIKYVSDNGVKYYPANEDDNNAYTDRCIKKMMAKAQQ